MKKKLKMMLSRVCKSAVVFGPGIAVAVCLAPSHGWFAASLAGVGAVAITAVVVTFGVVAAAKVKALRELEREKSNAAKEG